MNALKRPLSTGNEAGQEKEREDGKAEKAKVGENKGKEMIGEANLKAKEVRPRPALSTKTREHVPKGPIVIGAGLECNRANPRAPHLGARGAPAGLDTLNFARKDGAIG